MILHMDTNPAQRKLHVIDVENLIGHGEICSAEASHCRDVYEQTGLVGPRDHIVVACNPYIGFDVGSCWQPGRLLVRHGHDGADHALIQVLTSERIEERFTEVVVASGDGAFTDVVAWLQTHDVEVTVVAAAQSLSARLRLAASHVVIFDFPPIPTPAAAREEAA